MDLTPSAFGTWSGGRFMHFGEAIEDDRFVGLIRRAQEKGVRTFVTADVYGAGQADSLLSKGLRDFPREDYCLVGAIGHDFYEGQRAGSKGYPRFTDPDLRQPEGYREYALRAVSKSLERCGTDHFDLVLLHNPDSLGYTHEAVWKAMEAVREKGLASQIGIAPGPANGFTLDVIETFERYGELIDWAMLILNPLEPWPGRLALPAAKKHGVKVLTRVVDYGGLFHDDLLENHAFRPGDHRQYRPEGWVGEGRRKMEQMRELAEANGLSMLQFACQWNLAHEPVQSVVPTLIQEAGDEAMSIEEKLDNLAALPTDIRLSDEEVERIAEIGNNEGCMVLKGASSDFTEGTAPDRWGMRPELLEVAARWNLGTAW